MEYKDVQIKCKDCGTVFEFTASDQKYFISKGYHRPRRCKKCRRLRREEGINNVEKREN